MPLAGHLLHRLGKKGIPVAIAPINWELDPIFVQFNSQSPNQLATLFIDGAHAVEVVVMFGHRQHPLTGDIFTSKHIFQEGNDIVPAFWTAKRNE